VVQKAAVIRQVNSLSMSCDAVGNLLLAKFSYVGAKDSCMFISAPIVFWLLDNMPENQDPNLRPPGEQPQITQADWDGQRTPTTMSVQCMQFPDALRMQCELTIQPNVTLLLNRSCLELMRRYMLAYSKDLIRFEE
jgi:hypothetical protein